MMTKLNGSSARLWLMRLGAMVLIPALCFGALELLLRMAGFGYPTDYFVPSEVAGEGYLVPNTAFNYRFFPRALARAPLAQRILAEKPEGSVRIFLFGESAAYGDPDPAYGMGRYMEVLLRERFPGTEFEVVCTAMTAINSHAILPIARESAELDADLWLIYMGNNEMVGAYGAGTVFSSKAPPLGLVRLLLVLKKTKIGQLMDALAGSLKRGPEADADWDGINMFSKNLGFNDPGRLTAYDNFRGNLEDMLEVAADARIPVVLSTVASNLKDCAPFNSLFAEDMKAAEISEWKRHYKAALAFEDKGDWQGALERYSSAAAIDSTHAEMQFRIGRCHLALGNTTEAQHAFQLARDHDGLAVRADSRINAIIRKSAARMPAGSVQLVDAAATLSNETVGGPVGWELFYEHVHFTLAGNHRMARLLADEIVGKLPDSVTKSDTGFWLDGASCERELAATLWDQHRLWNNMKQRVSVPPHTAQLNNAGNVAHCEQQAKGVIARIGNDTPREDRALYQRMIARYPEDNLLRARFGQYLEAMGRRPEAIREFEKVCELLPDLEWPHFYLAELLIRAGRKDEARESLERALEIRPDFTQAIEKLESL